MVKGIYIDCESETQIECPLCDSDDEDEISSAEEARQECNWSEDDYKDYYGDDLENMSDEE